MRKVAGFLVVLAVSPFAPALSAAPQQEPQATALEFEPRSWMVPVHTQPDDPELGQYGLWAAGPGYKASFHEGFAFYPVLGEEAPENLPFVWRTESAAFGETALFEPGEEPEISTSSWRVEMRRSGLLEAYDVREDGVEQTFRIDAQPTFGDLVIRGRIATRLSREATESAHCAQVFRDDEGIARVRYGEAFAFDATGRRAEMSTRFDGKCLELRLAASWLASAAFPVTVDPLTSPVTVSVGLVAASSPDIAHDPIADQYWVTHSRAVSATDYDLYGHVIDDDLGSSATLVHSDLGSSWSSRHSQVGFAYATFPVPSGQWAVAFERHVNAGACRVRVHLHGSGYLVLNGGPTLPLNVSSTTHQRRPSVAGSRELGLALLVYQEEDTGNAVCAETATSTVHAAIVRVGTTWSINPSAQVAGGAALDAEWPSVSRQPSGAGFVTAYWTVAYQIYDNAIVRGDDWDVGVNQVNGLGHPTVLRLRAGQNIGPASSTIHKVRPKVDGAADRLLLSYTLVDDPNQTKITHGNGYEVAVQRLDWSSGSNSGTLLAPQTLASMSSPLGNVSTGDGVRGLAFDLVTLSHWGVAWRSTSFFTQSTSVAAARVGSSGCPVELVGAGSGKDPSIAYRLGAPGSHEYGLAYVGSGSSSPILARRFFYPGNAINQPYGNIACSGTIGANHPPYVGSELYRVELTGGRPQAFTALLFSLGSSGILFGNGCVLWIDLALSATWCTGTSDNTGGFACTVPIPDCPIATGDLFWQYLQIDPLTQQIVSSNGLAIQIR